ncbi:TetR/AcrR family transcriptional regulator [Spirochaetota bacterium]
MPPKGERRKKQIIDTAKEMFIEKGFQSTHIGQVCEKLNIARGTVYQYFSNKKEILYALLDSVLERVEDALDYDDLTEFFDKNPSQEQILEFSSRRIKACISILTDEPIVMKLIYKQIAGIDEEVIERVNGTVAKVQSLVTIDIKFLVEKGFYNSDLNSSISASVLVGALMYLIFEYDSKGKNILENGVIEEIGKIYLNGVLKC